MTNPSETDLYPPIKALLESQGYEVKAEIGAADVVALRGDDPPVIVELKLTFSLALIHQCIARQALSDTVYMAVAHSSGKRFAKSLRDNRALARRLGLGLITVRMADGHVQIHCDPAPYSPRKSKPRQTRLLREFARRSGDPNTGGQTRQGLVTAYRQDALSIANYLAGHSPAKGADVARATGVTAATRVMADNHYGWFERIARGIYLLTPQGHAALSTLDPPS
jgi:hypothetical protein